MALDSQITIKAPEPLLDLSKNQDIVQTENLISTKSSKTVKLITSKRFLSICTELRSRKKLSCFSLFPIPVAFLIGWILIPHLLKQFILKKAVISQSQNPELYEAWVHPPIPIFFKVYVFNVTNAPDVFTGAFPNLQEIGPYVFRENRTKIDIVHQNQDDIITYKERITYHFDDKKSGNLSLSDEITILNVPYLAAAIKTTDLPWPINDLAKTVLLRYKEPLYLRKSVGKILFQGWRVPFLDAIENDIGLILMPKNTFSYFGMQNDTAQGPYTISCGSKDKSLFGSVIKYKNKTSLNFWDEKSSSCNQIKGTDGSIFPPLISKSTTLHIFNAELCRSIHLTYQKIIKVRNINAYRFTAPKSVLMDPRKSIENRCFCDTIESNPEKCLKQGALDIGPCRDGAPIALSTPHFFDGDEEYIKSSGLNPNPEKHETFLDIEPLTGIVVRASKKIQINLKLKKVKGVTSLSKVPDMLFPLVWADEFAELDQPMAKRLENILENVWLIEVSTKCGLLFAAAFTTVVFWYKPTMCKKS